MENSHKIKLTCSAVEKMFGISIPDEVREAVLTGCEAAPCASAHILKELGEAAGLPLLDLAGTTTHVGVVLDVSAGVVSRDAATTGGPGMTGTEWACIAEHALFELMGHIPSYLPTPSEIYHAIDFCRALRIKGHSMTNSLLAVRHACAVRVVANEYNCQSVVRTLDDLIKADMIVG